MCIRDRDDADAPQQLIETLLQTLAQQQASSREAAAQTLGLLHELQAELPQALPAAAPQNPLDELLQHQQALAELATQLKHNSTPHD